MASSDSVQQIKERLSIVDVVSPYVELHQAGKNFKGKSPFTNEKTPSFYVSPDRGMYYCFSSSQGGDIFTFIQKMEGVEFKEALKILADKAGVELVPEDPKKKTERERLYDALEEATKFFEVYRQKNSDVITYLTNRGVQAETIAKWRIGYAPGPSKFGWRELKEHLEGKGFTKDELFKAGLIKGADAGKEPYDVFRDRVMFPIFDASGKVVAFSGRILSNDTEAPKYVNSPETELFNKSEILYGYHLAKNGIRALDFALAVEGQFDVVLSHQAGYSNTVAVSGTALTLHHVMLLQRLSNKVVLALDADKAGIAAVKRAAELMLPRGIDLKVANVVGGKDPADLIKEDPHAFKKVVGSAKPVVEYFLDIFEAQKKDDRQGKLRVREELLPLLLKMSNRIDQEHFETVIAERIATTKDAVHAEVEQLRERMSVESKKTTYQHDVSSPQETSSNRSRKETLTQEVAVLITVFIPQYIDLLGNLFKEITTQDVAEVFAAIEPTEKSKRTFEYEEYVQKNEVKHLLENMVSNLNRLHTHYLVEVSEKHNEALALAEADGDEEARIRITKEIDSMKLFKKEPKYSIELFA